MVFETLKNRDEFDPNKIQLVHNGEDYSDYSVVGLFFSTYCVQDLYKSWRMKTGNWDSADFKSWLLERYGIRELEWQEII